MGRSTKTTPSPAQASPKSTELLISSDLITNVDKPTSTFDDSLSDTSPRLVIDEDPKPENVTSPSSNNTLTFHGKLRENARSEASDRVYTKNVYSGNEQPNKECAIKKRAPDNGVAVSPFGSEQKSVGLDQYPELMSVEQALEIFFASSDANDALTIYPHSSFSVNVSRPESLPSTATNVTSPTAIVNPSQWSSKEIPPPVASPMSCPEERPLQPAESNLLPPKALSSVSLPPPNNPTEIRMHNPLHSSLDLSPSTPSGQQDASGTKFRQLNVAALPVPRRSSGSSNQDHARHPVLSYMLSLDPVSCSPQQDAQMTVTPRGILVKRISDETNQGRQSTWGTDPGLHCFQRPAIPGAVAAKGLSTQRITGLVQYVSTMLPVDLSVDQSTSSEINLTRNANIPVVRPVQRRLSVAPSPIVDLQSAPGEPLCGLSSLYPKQPQRAAYLQQQTFNSFHEEGVTCDSRMPALDEFVHNEKMTVFDVQAVNQTTPYETNQTWNLNQQVFSADPEKKSQTPATVCVPRTVQTFAGIRHSQHSAALLKQQVPNLTDGLNPMPVATSSSNSQMTLPFIGMSPAVQQQLPKTTAHFYGNFSWQIAPQPFSMPGSSNGQTSRSMGIAHPQQRMPTSSSSMGITLPMSSNSENCMTFYNITSGQDNAMKYFQSGRGDMSQISGPSSVELLTTFSPGTTSTHFSPIVAQQTSRRHPTMANNQLSDGSYSYQHPVYSNQSLREVQFVNQPTHGQELKRFKSSYPPRYSNESLTGPVSSKAGKIQHFPSSNLPMERYPTPGQQMFQQGHLIQQSRSYPMIQPTISNNHLQGPQLKPVSSANLSSQEWKTRHMNRPQHFPRQTASITNPIQDLDNIQCKGISYTNPQGFINHSPSQIYSSSYGTFPPHCAPQMPDKSFAMPPAYNVNTPTYQQVNHETHMASNYQSLQGMQYGNPVIYGRSVSQVHAYTGDHSSASLHQLAPVIGNEPRVLSNDVYHSEKVQRLAENLQQRNQEGNSQINEQQIRERNRQAILQRNQQEILQRNQQEILQRNQQEILQRNQQEILQRNQQEILQKNQQEIHQRNQQEILQRNQQEILQRNQQEILQRNQQEILQRNEQEILQRNEQEILQRNEQEILQTNEQETLQRNTQEISQQYAEKTPQRNAEAKEFLKTQAALGFKIQDDITLDIMSSPRVQSPDDILYAEDKDINFVRLGESPVEDKPPVTLDESKHLDPAEYWQFILDQDLEEGSFIEFKKLSFEEKWQQVIKRIDVLLTKLPYIRSFGTQELKLGHATLGEISTKHFDILNISDTFGECLRALHDQHYCKDTDI